MWFWNLHIIDVSSGCIPLINIVIGTTHDESDEMIFAYSLITYFSMDVMLNK